MLTLLLFLENAVVGQQLSCNNKAIETAFKLALSTVDINTRRGILAAGADYGGEWTRDIAINSWNGVSLFRPEVAEQSLWSVTVNRDTVGHQYWDKIIWVQAALNHYLVTGDKIFLEKAFACSAKTMQRLEGQVFDDQYGLFKGPSVFNDGIAGYPEPVFEPGNTSSAVVDHQNSSRIKCLSTNCVYYGAYRALGRMSALLAKPAVLTAAYQQKAANLKMNILKYFDDGIHLNYLVDQNGKVDHAQEGLGISFAVIFGIVEGDKARELIGKAVVSRFGITSITPDFKRYSAQMPGRHNNIIWPMVNGFFAQAAIASGNYNTFASELFNQTHLALDADKGDYDFREVYNPYTGKPDGGWQANGPQYPNYHWESCKLQTWSATAYISMVVKGLFGLSLNEESISLSPFLPAGIDLIELKDFNYRNATLHIVVKGGGSKVKKFSVDGRPQANHNIPSTLKGAHNILIEVE